MMALGRSTAQRRRFKTRPFGITATPDPKAKSCMDRSISQGDPNLDNGLYIGSKFDVNSDFSAGLCRKQMFWGATTDAGFVVEMAADHTD